MNVPMMSVAPNGEYIIDIDTPNISFVQTAIDLKNLGIENCYFFLALYDPSLKGVDPYSPMLSEDTIMRILLECTRNPWYYLREVSRIPATGNPNGVRYELDRANLAQAWCILNGIDTYEVKPRQTGKTQSTIALLLWAFNFGSTNTEMASLNLDMTMAKTNIERLKAQRDCLPEYMRMNYTFDEEGKVVKGKDSAMKLYNSNTKNSIIPKPKAMSNESAETIGRGSTQAIQLWDEFDFMYKNKTIMEASGPAYMEAARRAEMFGSMHARIFISTPGDLDSEQGQSALQVIEKTYTWSETFYDKGVDFCFECLQDSENQIMYIEYSYKQLGKDEEWFKAACRTVNNEPLKIKREILLQRLRGSSLSPYDPNDLAIIEEYKGTILKETYIHKIYKLIEYDVLDRNKIYFVGVDVANGYGYGEDNSAITIWNPYTLKTVAEFKSPFIGVPDLINFIYKLIKKYIPKSILAIERNANGEAVIASLMNTDIAFNIYYNNSQDAFAETIDSSGNQEAMLDKIAKQRKLRGIWTGPKSREQMFALLDNHIKDHKDKFIGHYIINDLFALVRNKQGKIVAGSGFHDDNIMSFNMCLYLYYYGKNLVRYGFTRSHEMDYDDDKSYQDEDPYELLSDADKKFFENAPRERYKDYTKNIYTMINQAHQFIDSKDIENEINDSHASFNPIYNSHDQEMYNELKENYAWSQAVNRQIGGKTSTIEDMDGGIDDGDTMDLSVFDYLNDM